MTAAEIIAASKLPVSEDEKTERAKRFRKLVDEAQISFKEQSARLAVTNEQLERTCNL